MQIKPMRDRLLASTIIAGSIVFTAPAFAQNAGDVANTPSGPVEGAKDVTAPATAATPAGEETIVVTGSRIPQPNLTSVAPVTVVGTQDVKLQGVTRVEDLLNSLPSVSAQQTSGVSNGADGTASIDLRGLGTNRTLTLVNGRRLLPGDPSPTSGSAADINIIPASMLKRVEVLTGGASSTYGADAVAGVVNFIMDTDFEGIRLDANYGLYNHNNRNKILPPLLDARQRAGLSGYDYPSGNVTDGGQYDATLSIGSSFDDNRGHAVAYAGYRRVRAVDQSKRDYSACVLQNTGGGAPRCGGSATSGNGNVLVFPSFAAGTSTFYTFGPGGAFDNSTTLYNFGPTNYFQRPDERYVAGMFANYEVNDAIKPYMEFMFMDDRTIAQIAPSGDFANTYTINCDNPLLSAAQRAVVCAPANLINGFLGSFPLAAGAPYNDGTAGTPGAAGAPIAFANTAFNGRNNATYNRGYFNLLRRNVEGGPRRADLQHTNYRFVIGTKGDLSPAWSYDAYYQYGKVVYSQVYSNEFSVARLNRALDVISDPRAGAGFGQPVCRSAVDGSDPNCVPYNVFNGAGAASPAAVNYLSATGFQKGFTSEQVASGSITGDLSKYGIQTPWADSGLAVNLGYEYRKESLDLNTDNAFQTGDLTGQGGATLPISGSFHVNEVFAEARLPIAHDSLVYDLFFEGGYRRSWYETSANRKFSTNTFKLGGEFAPIRDIRVRGGYNRAVRAPNIQELFATPTVGLNGSEDPCAALGRPVRATDYGCLAQGLRVGQGVTGNPAGQYNGLIGGNADLRPEKATTKTVGIVLQPRFAPRLAVTVDYFDIKVANAIRSFGQDAILADCVARATATFTPASCGLVNRDAAGSLWLTPNGYVRDLPNNVGTLQVKGIEVGGSYSQPLGGLGNLSLSMQGTYLKNYKVNNGLSAPYDCAGLYGPTCSVGGTTDAGSPLPKWRHKARATWQTRDGVGVSVQWRYIGKVRAETTSQYATLQGDNPLNPGLKLKAQSYIDLAATFDVGDHYNLRLGVNNVFDKQPPLVTSGNAGLGGSNLCPTGPCNGNTYPGTYDALGRYLYAGVTLNF